jgi:HTH-type transcriptional regulator, competence development regulator
MPSKKLTRLSKEQKMTTVGQRIREIRKQRNLTQRELADRVGINFTYLSRVENDRLDDEQTPREDTLQKIAQALDTDSDELLLLARRIPDAFRNRILAKPGIFRRILNLSDVALEEMLAGLEAEPATEVVEKPKARKAK